MKVMPNFSERADASRRLVQRFAGPAFGVLTSTCTLLLVSQLLAACSPKDENAAQMFEQKVQPFFEEKCGPGCHEPEGYGPHEGVNFFVGAEYGSETVVSVPADQVAMNLIEPGDPSNSYLWRKMKNTHQEVGGTGQPMPYADWPSPDADLRMIEEYILLLGE